MDQEAPMPLQQTDDDYLRIVPRGGAVDKSMWRIEAK
jgi:hypothetical protein